MLRIKLILSSVAIAFLVSACATTTPTASCNIAPGSDLNRAVAMAEDKLASGCAYHFDEYFDAMLAIAADNPDADNKQVFSNFLVGASDAGTISKRQARALYNRYFNVKFVSLTGDYNTCSQTCPTRARVLADMERELLDKELGLMKASGDSASYYRADLLLKEAQLVLEATCQACEAGAR